MVEQISRFGQAYHHGLEAGSKAELITAIAFMHDPEAFYIVCNGYKDTECITLGLQAIRLGYRCFFVLETPTELPIVLETSRALGVRPMLGVRVKLAARVGGAWNESSGDRSIFGLTTSQIVELIDSLRRHEMLDCLQLLHYHLGSQIPNTRDIRSGVLEAGRYYADLKQEGAPLGFLDLGGGLAVDYDGSQTNYDYSKNYSLDEYRLDVVEQIMSVLDPLGIEHPVIVTESGRATVAYSSVLLFNILDATRFEPAEVPARAVGGHEHAADRQPARVAEEHQSAQPAGVLQRRGVLPRGAARALQARADPAPGPVARGEHLPRDRACDRPRAAGRQTHPARARRPRAVAVGHLLRQLLGLPVPARRVGDRAGLPGHAGASPQRAADAAGGHGRHHLRLRRQD